MEIIRNNQKYIKHCIFLIIFALIYIIAYFIGVLQIIDIAYFRPLRGHKLKIRRLQRFCKRLFYGHLHTICTQDLKRQFLELYRD